jgi:MFS family permease
VLVLNAASFLASAGLVGSIRAHLGPWEVAGERRLSLRVPQPRFVLPLALATAVLMLGAGLEGVAQVPLAASIGLGPAGLGYLVTAWSAGALAGALGARLVPRARESAALRLGFAATAAGLAIVGLGASSLTALVGQFVGGVGEGIAMVAGQVLLQRSLAEGSRGAAIATVEGAGTVAIALGHPMGGVVADRAGAPAAYVAAAALALGGLVPLAFVRARAGFAGRG